MIIIIKLQVITPEMQAFLDKVREKVVLGIVGGSDYAKIKEQLGSENGKVWFFSNVK